MCCNAVQASRNREEKCRKRSKQEEYEGKGEPNLTPIGQSLVEVLNCFFLDNVDMCAARYID